MRLLHLIAAAVAIAGLLPACVPIDRASRPFSRARVQPLGQCEVANGQGTAAGQNYARAIAESGVRQETADVKGALLVSGLRHIRAEPVHVTCRTYVLGGGLTQCLASRRFCGR